MFLYISVNFKSLILPAQAEYAIWLEKRTAQQVSHLPTDPMSSPYGYAHGPGSNITTPSGFPSANSLTTDQCKDSASSPGTQKDVNHSNSVTNCGPILSNKAGNHNSKKISKTLEEESVV